MKNKLATLLFAALATTIICYYINIKITENNIKNEKNVIDTTSTNKIDTTLNNNFDTTKVDTTIVEMLPIDSNIYEFVSDTTYYVIIGSFKIQINALNFKDNNKESEIIINDNYNMVYIYKTNDSLDAISIRNTNKEKYQGIWIYKNIE